MKEYTVFACVSVLVTIAVDRHLKVFIMGRREYYIFLLAIVFFKFLVNGFLTGKEIVLYNPKFYLGLRIGSIPVEDFFFGFSMVTLTIIFWEFFKKKKCI